MIFAEVLYWLYEANFGIDRQEKERFWQCYNEYDLKTLQRFSQTFHDILLKHYPEFDKFLSTFSKASEILLFMGEGTVFQEGDDYFGWIKTAIPLSHKTQDIATPQFDPLSEFYIVDMIGNTISADLLDYALRDMQHAGLTATYDNRLLQYFTLVRNPTDLRFARTDEQNGEIETFTKEEPPVVIRMAINLFRRRIRIDALSEILQILNLRYLLTERVLFHRTKCAASSMLGKAIRLLDPDGDHLDRYIFWGDSKFLSYLEKLATRKINKAAKAEDPDQGIKFGDALNLIRGIRSRHYYKPVFHMKSIDRLKPEENNHPAKLLSQPAIRSRIEEEIESFFGFASGSVIVYCPEKTHLKEAECLVIVDRANRVKKVMELSQQKGFEHYGDEANIVAQKYGVLWNMYIFVPKRLICYWKAIEDKFVKIFNNIRREYEEQFPGIVAVHQDDDLCKYLESSTVAVSDEYRAFAAKLGTETFAGVVQHVEEVTLNAGTQQRDLFHVEEPYVDKVRSALRKRLDNESIAGHEQI